MNQKTLNIILIVVLVILLSMVIFLFVDREKGEKNDQDKIINKTQDINVDDKKVDDQKISDQTIQDELNNGVIPTEDSIQSWQDYSNKEYGISLKYPSAWKLTENDSAGSDYKVITRIVNPLYAGKPDTDVPIEQLLIRVQEIKCSGDPIVIDGRNAKNKTWYKGFGNYYYRELCFQGQDWPLTITLITHNESSETIMDQVLSSFKFTR